MPPPDEIIPDLEMSMDERVRVFRRTFHGKNLRAWKLMLTL